MIPSFVCDIMEVSSRMLKLHVKLPLKVFVPRKKMCSCVKIASFVLVLE